MTLLEFIAGIHNCYIRIKHLTSQIAKRNIRNGVFVVKSSQRYKRKKPKKQMVSS